jgi:hypothetical protein
LGLVEKGEIEKWDEQGNSDGKLMDRHSSVHYLKELSAFCGAMQVT